MLALDPMVHAELHDRSPGIPVRFVVKFLSCTAFSSARLVLTRKDTFPATIHHTVSCTIHRCCQTGTRPSMRLGGCTGEVVPGAGSTGYFHDSFMLYQLNILEIFEGLEMCQGMFLGHLELQVLGPFLMGILVDCGSLSVCSDTLVGPAAKSSKETHLGESIVDTNARHESKCTHQSIPIFAEDHLCRWSHGYL